MNPMNSTIRLGISFLLLSFLLSTAFAASVSTYPNPAAGNPPLTVTFNVTSQYSNPKYVINYGDGTSETGGKYRSSFRHTYYQSTMYGVKVSIYPTPASRYATENHNIFVRVYAQNQVSLTTSPSNPYGKAPYTVYFRAQASPSDRLSFQWTFGDGGSSTQQNPWYTYRRTGTFTAKLTVYRAGYVLGTAQKTVVVSR